MHVFHTLRKTKKGRNGNGLKGVRRKRGNGSDSEKKTHENQGAPCISEPVPVHEVVLPQDEENVIDNKKKKNDFTEYDAGTDLLLLQGSRIQREKKQDEASSIACVEARTILPTSQATRKTVFLANVETLSQGKKFVTLSKLKRQRPEVSNHNPPVFIKPSAVVHENVAPINRRRKLKPPTVRKINTSLIVKTSGEPTGSGTFGQVFLAEYHDMKSVVKEMKRRSQSYKENVRCKREVLHEATVINSLGDHPNLPFLFGVCTGKEPFSLVLQFYGKRGKSLTLHMVVRARMLKKQSTTKVFQEIINTLEYIHDKGYVHNDLKANNVILDWWGDEFHPILIDFGKSEQISKVEGYKRRAPSDIAPEVILGEKEGPPSDIYSFEKMLEAAVSGRSFCNSFKEVISETKALAASDRPSTRKFPYSSQRYKPVLRVKLGNELLFYSG